MNQFYMVEDIVGIKYNKKIKEWMYKVRWQGYDPNYTTWEPESNLQDVKHLLHRFHDDKSLCSQKGQDKSNKKRKTDTIIPVLQSLKNSDEKYSTKTLIEQQVSQLKELSSDQNQENLTWQKKIDELIRIEFNIFLRSFMDQGSESQSD